ncbi:MAG: protein-tyrosine-phosphatase [Bacteroidota bacterium]
MSVINTTNLFPALRMSVEELIDQAKVISPERMDVLNNFANYIINKIAKKEAIKLNFICTHNSRRSHLAQIWAAVAADYHNLNLSSYSGGTEATALAPQVANALKRLGFKVEHKGDDNPSYQFSYSSEKKPIICFSKTYDDDFNPVKSFAAIMTCTDADEKCPFVPGSEFRLALPYQDPKQSDGLPTETNTYDQTVQRIGREMFYLMYLVKNSTEISQ